MSRRSALLLLPIFACLAQIAWSAAGEAATITVWGWVYAVDCLKANLEEFTKANPQIKVVFKTVAPADIYLRLPTALANGIGLPDVVVLEDSHVAPMISTGGLLDLTARVAPYRAKFNVYKWAAVSSGGRVYAMPWDSAPVALFYRRDLFAAAGLPSAPEEVARLLATWEDYYRAVNTIKEKTGAYALPLSGPRNDGRLFEILLQQQGGGYFDERGRVILDDSRGSGLKTLEFLGRLYKEGLAHESVPWEDPWYTAIREGKVATLIGGAYLESFLRNWIAPNAAGLWGVVPLPRWAQGEGARTAGDGGTSLAIPKRSPRTEAAWAFVRFMLARPASQLNMLKKYDSFPALEETYKDPYFQRPLPFYADQPVLGLFAELAREVPPWHYTVDYATANSLCSAEIQAYLMGSKDAKAALAAAASAIRAKTGRR